MSLTNPVHRQRFILVASVLLLHALALWALQSGLLQRRVAADQEVVIAVQAITEQPRPRPAPPIPTASPDKVVPAPRQMAAAVAAPVQPTTTPAVAPAFSAIADPTPVVNAPAGAQAAQPAVPAPVQPAALPSAPPKVELPSSTAEYLHNPKPLYPRLSHARNEQGTVILSVLVGVDGKVRDVVVKSSSGFDLLDRSAREAVLRWTFVPGKLNGVLVEMLAEVPVPFRLTD